MVKVIGNTLTIKLVGNPWLPEDDSKSIKSKVLITALVNALDHKNWLLYGTRKLKDTADTTIITN